MESPDGSSLLASGGILSSLLLLLMLVLLNAFFAMSEIAIISLNDNKIKRMAREGDKKAGIIVRLTAEPSKFLATIQVGVTLSGFFASAVAADTFAEYIVAALAGTAIPPATIRTAAVFIITLLLSYVTLVFGELVPKRVAMQHYEKISFAVAGLLSFLSMTAKPFVFILSASANTVLRLLRIDPNQKPEEVTEEEIRMMIDVGGESGSIDQNEKDMLNNIFEFDDRTAEEMMTHRTEVTAVEVGTPLAEVVGIALDSGHSRIPVYEDSLDSIVGVLYVKDLLSLLTERSGESFDLKQFMRTPLYVLESTGCMSLLEQFQSGKIQMAVVVDEYGGTSGLVTMEDLLESIVGNIQDEYDDEEEEIADLGDGSYLVDGLTALEDVLKFFELGVEDADNYDTIGGYIVSELGYIPDPGESPSVLVRDVQFTIQEMDERRIARLLVRVISNPLEEAPAEFGSQGA